MHRRRTRNRPARLFSLKTGKTKSKEMLKSKEMFPCFLLSLGGRAVRAVQLLISFRQRPFLFLCFFLLLRFVIIRFHGNPPPEIGVTGFSGIFIVCSSAFCIHAGTKVDAARKNVPEMETCCRKETQNEETRFLCRIASSFVRHEGTGPPGRE